MFQSLITTLFYPAIIHMNHSEAHTLNENHTHPLALGKTTELMVLCTTWCCVFTVAHPVICALALRHQIHRCFAALTMHSALWMDLDCTLHTDIGTTMELYGRQNQNKALRGSAVCPIRSDKQPTWSKVEDACPTFKAYLFCQKCCSNQYVFSNKNRFLRLIMCVDKKKENHEWNSCCPYISKVIIENKITSNFITGKTEVKAKIILLHTYLSLCSCRNTQ